MTVTNVEKDHEALTMTITAEFDVPVARVWQLWSDPRQLERWWGPPTYPATVVGHDLSVGGAVSYFMTGPDGDQSHGWWKILDANEHHFLEFENGLADATGAPNPNTPVMIVRATFDEVVTGRTRMSITSTFPSAQAMDVYLTMGMEEGMTLAVSQIDALI